MIIRAEAVDCVKTFEQGFAEVERAADATVKATASVASLAKQLQKAARLGDITAIHRLSERLASASEAARQDVSNARSSWPFRAEDEEEYLRAGYEQELLDVARDSGLRIDSRDGALVSFPSIVRILPQARALKVDRRKVTTLRPTAIVASLVANQTRKPAFATERFLEAVYRAYRLIVEPNGPGSVAPLSIVYEALTLLPGSALDFGTNDFARGLFLLDRSGITTTRSGARVSLPASTGTKSAKGVFTFVAPDGHVLTYYGIRFEPAA